MLIVRLEHNSLWGTLELVTAASTLWQSPKLVKSLTAVWNNFATRKNLCVLKRKLPVYLTHFFCILPIFQPLNACKISSLYSNKKDTVCSHLFALKIRPINWNLQLVGQKIFTKPIYFPEANLFELALIHQKVKNVFSFSCFCSLSPALTEPQGSVPWNTKISHALLTDIGRLLKANLLEFATCLHLNHIITKTYLKLIKWK